MRELLGRFLTFPSGIDSAGRNVHGCSVQSSPRRSAPAGWGLKSPPRAQAFWRGHALWCAIASCADQGRTISESPPRGSGRGTWRGPRTGRTGRPAAGVRRGFRARRSCRGPGRRPGARAGRPHPVCDDDHRPAPCQPLDALVHRRLVARVQCGGHLVEEDDGCVRRPGLGCRARRRTGRRFGADRRFRPARCRASGRTPPGNRSRL